MSYYNKLINALPNRALWNNQINNIMSKHKFNLINYIGCFPYDQIPKLFYEYKKIKDDDYKCCIVNNKTVNQGGEHWLSLIKQNGMTYIYDSFQRESENENLKFPKKWIELADNKDIIQNIFEVNCGARCIALLLCVDKYGLTDTEDYL